MRNLYTVVKLCFVSFLFFVTFQSNSQTVLINPATDGGFESGADFALNGWTVSNTTNLNQWQLGTVPGSADFTSRAAYISNDAGVSWAFTNTSISVSHFYRDVVIPAGETEVTLSFNWQALGETGAWDALMVSIAPTSYTPAGSTVSVGSGGLAAPANTFAQLWNNNTYQTATIKIPRSLLNNCSGASTLRLIFTWKNDDNSGTNPPAAVDNISLTSQAPARVIGVGPYSIDQTMANTGTNFTTFTEAINSLNGSCFSSNVVFNVAAGQTFTEDIPALTATGTSSATITFQKSGAGVNPVIIPLTAGTIASSTTLGSNGDAIFVIEGGDYITIDGIDLQTDASFTTNGMYEYGYYLKKASVSDASKNVTIKNCNITLNKAARYSWGIYVSNTVGTSTGITVADVGGRSENIKIFGNTITNVYGGIQVRGYDADSPYDLYDQNIEIGVDGANTITNFGGGASTAYGVYGIYQNNLRVNNNVITGGTGTTTTQYGIFLSTGVNSNVDIIGNTLELTNASTTSTVYAINNAMGGSGTSNTVNIGNNIVQNLSWTTATSGNFYGVYQNATSFISNIYGNLVRDITRPGTGTSYYVYNANGAASGSANIYQNKVYNITHTGAATFYGVYSNAVATTTTAIYENEVYNITAGSTVNGLTLTTSDVTQAYKNKIYDLSSTATGTTAPYVSGILITSGVNPTVFNNLIGNLTAPTANSVDAIRGINITSTTSTSNIGVYFNTVYLDAAVSSGTNFGTTGIYHTASSTATTATLDLRNNIIINNSARKGTGRTVAFRRSSATANTLNNYASTSNNNLFYATGSPDANHLIFYNGTQSAETIADYKAFTATSGTVAPRDNASVSGNPPFLSTTGSDATFLHIDPSIPTQVESGGLPVTGITTDFDGNTRDAASPDLGADEGTFTINDISGPGITYDPISNTGCLTAPGLTATITDASNVNVTAGTKPRLYFKRSTDANAYNNNTNATDGWKYVEATNATSPFTFTFDYSLLNGGTGIASGQTVEYFVVAQDMNPSGTPNIAINSGTFNTTPASVNLTGTAFPIGGTINSFNLATGINPSVTIGAAGTYPTITGTGGLFEAINNGALTANTVAEIIDATVTETGTVALNPIAYGCAAATLTIRPATGVTTVLSGSTTASNALIKISGADNVIIDGSNNGTTTRDLTIQNTSTSGNTTAIWISSLGTGMGAENITIKNTNLMAGSNTVTTTHGIYVGGTSITTSATGDDNDNLTIQNNSISKAYYGIYAQASATGVNNGLNITQNSIGSNTAADYIGQRPMLVSQADGAVVSGNTVFNIIGGSSTIFYGMEFGAGVVNTEISKNTIYNIDATTVNRAGKGIALASGVAAANVTVSNNMISGLKGHGSTTASNNSWGIMMNNGGGYNIYYNSINISDDRTTTFATPSGDRHGAIYIASSVTDVNLKNNNISVTGNPAALTTAGTPGRMYGIYSLATAPFTASNYNNIYVNGGQHSSGYISSTNQDNLSAWQTASSQDANSVSIEPVFTSATDLHLVPGMNAQLDNLGNPVTGITTDIDGDARNATTPDMGADEFTAPSCTGAVGGTASAPTTTYCESGTPTITATGYSTGANSGYQWQSSTDLAFTTPVDIVGQTNPAALTLAAPVTATTYYRLKVNCTTAPMEDFSNVVTVTINLNPTVNITPAGPIDLCAPATQLLTANTNAGSATYQWKNNGVDITSETAATYTASASGSYTVFVTDGATTCTNTSAAVVVTVNPVPTGVTAGASSSSICTGSSIDLTGGVTSAPATILTQDFESGIGSWTTTNNTTGGTPANTEWTIRPHGYVYTGLSITFNSPGGTNFILSNSDAAGSGSSINATLQSPSFSTIGYSAASLSFRHHYRHITNPVNVEASIDGTTWTSIKAYSSTQGTSTAFTTDNIDLSAYLNQPAVYIRFNYFNGWLYYWAIDDISITGTPINYTYGWTSNPAGFTSADQSPTGVSPTVTTTYTFTVTGIAGCTSTAQTTVNVAPASDAGSLNGNQTICIGGTPNNIVATGTIGDVVRWESSADAAFTTPTTIANTTTTLSPGALTASTYYRVVVKSGVCSEAVSATPVLITVNTAITPSMSLAGSAGGAQVCSNQDIAASVNYFYGNCDIIATIDPSGATPVSGMINVCVKIENGVPTAPVTNEPYVARHYNIMPATNATTATSVVTLYFLQSEFDDFNAASGGFALLPTSGTDNTGKANLRVSQFPGTATTPGTAGGVQIDPADVNIAFANGRWSVSFDVVGSGSFFVHTGNFTLPVTLVNFRGEQAGSTNRLMWSTSTETNNKGFELERSANGSNFSTITFVATKAENGNSTSTLNYNYNDVRPSAGDNYYRLKQIDRDGKTTYSNIVLLSRKVSDITLSSVYPNPATRELNLVITSPKAEKVTIVITDLTGKVVAQRATQLMTGDNQESFDVQQLAAGTYFIKAICANGCETAVQRFVRQ